jgi:hypothetical protein
MATLQEVVNTAYLQALGRPADPDGLKHYVAQLESGKRVDGRRIGIGDILADLNYAAATGVEDKAANQAITARGGWDFAPPPPPPAPSGGGGGGGSSVTPPGSEYDYISDLYTTYLGRGASAEELASYAKILGPTIEPNEIRDFILGGVTSGEISSTLAADLLKTLPPPAAATEPLTAQGLYNQFLGGRPALEKDLQFWNNYIAQYGPEQAMAAFDAAADQERNMDLKARADSLRDQELARDGTVMKDGEKTVREGALTAQGLYNEFLGGRSALPADIDYWNNYIAVYGPDKARAAFQESAKPEKEMPVEERVKSLRDQNLTVPGSLFEEFATQRKATPAEVRSMYLSVLGREPDPEGFSYYTSQPVENLRQSFYQASLPEMEKRVGAIDVTTTIPTPVIGQRSEPTAQELYLGLGRAPDPAGLAFYENYSGPNREAAFAAGAAEKGEQYDPTKPMTIGLPGQTTTTSLSGMTPQQRDLSRLVVSKMPQPVSETTTAPSVFSPENVAAQLELERLKAMNAPRTTDQGTPVAGFAQGGLVNDDINRMLQNQRNAVMRESQSRRMLNTLGAPPVKKFSDGGPAGSSSGVRRLKMSGYQKGGDVTDEMFVGTAPSEESQQTTGEYIKGLYKENIPVHARVYLETLLGKKDPITADDFTKEELADIEKLLSSKPAKGAVTEYSDYEKVRDLDREGRHSSDWLENLPSVGKTLGRFTYETLPDGRRVIKDTYDFYNTSRSINVQEFEEMGPAEKALAVFKKITADRSVMDPPFVKRAADILGEAYIGRDGRPVKVEYDPKDLPVKRQEGSPSQGEISDDMFVGTRPEDFPETSPVDTAVSDFISSRSKLVTDPQEFFRVMGQNIEEYHGKPLREDPQKYLTEQLGPGALAGTVGKTAKQLFSSLPSSEAPFVGRLDEFVSSLPGAVQKDQFLNQLKGKFRDYDIGRAQEALADLPGNAKLTPFELLNRVKRVYDPTTFTTKIDYPKIDDYHAEIDNPFQTKKGFSQKPLGVIHLLQGVNPTTSPDAAKLMAAYEDITNRLPGTTFYSFDKTDRNPVSLAQDIYKIASRAGLSSVEDLGMDVQTVLQNMSQSGSDWSKLVSSKTMLGNPGRYRPEEIKEVLNETARITGALPEENVKSLQKIAEEINARRTAKQDYSDLESQYHKSFPYAFAEDLEKANRRLWNEHREGKQQIEGLLEGLQKREGIKARVYRGQHSSLAEDSSTIRDPIAFSRFTEHTTDIPGLGKVDGIYVNELQSDRLDDIRKKGRMGGGPQEDITRLDKLDKQIGEAARQFADYKTAMGFRFMNETDKAKISDFNSKLEGLNTKRNTLLDRIREGEYSLKESFAGMEESPQVIQQLMAKNAVAGAMQLGKRFVAFPGAESAQSQLYEKLPNNLKQVVKDLGPGFELRPITLPKPDTSAGGEGGELTSYAIVWGNEAADRIKKQGVPFKDGGEVSTEDFIKRFSKGEMANDEFIQEMMTGTRPTDETTSPGILPPEIRQAVDVPLDFANLLIRGTAAVPIGGAAGLYKGITGGKYGTQEGVKEADTEAARMMAKITGEPKTQAAKDVLEFIGGKAQEYKLDAALPQLLTLPSPGPGAASALMRSYELAETPPLGTVKLAGDKGVKPATPPTDQMGFYSPAEKAVMGLPQDKGTASQMLAQITKTQGVKPVELRATGLEDYLKGKGNEPVTKQEIQDFLTNNRVQVDEVVLGRGLSMSPESKRLMEDAEKRMMKADQVMAPFFEQQEAGSLLQGQEPYSTFYRIRGPLSRKIAKGDQEALAELDALNLPPDIRQAVLDFGSAKLDYQKHSKPARFEQKPKFDGYNTSGGTNAREIYLTLPGEQMPSSSPPSVNAQGVLVKPMYATQPKFTAPPQHSVSPEADANRLAHIFLDERKDAKGDKVLFVQEMQSDWAQIGKKKGFRTPPDPTALEAAKTKISQAEQALRQKSEELFNRGQRVQDHPERQVALEQVVQAKNELETLMQNSRLPPAPFVTNTEDWVNLALKRVIKEAVDNDIDTVAFIKGGQAADKYSLRTFVDYISADRKTTSGVEHLPGATDDLYVFIAPKDSLSPHAFYVGPDGIIKEPISADVRSKFLGEPLSKVIGKEAAEKLLSTKTGESQVLRDEGLTLGGKGMEGFYDNILPKTAEKLLKKLGGGKVEPVEMVKAAPSQMPYEANAFLHWMSFRHPGTSRSDAARAWGMGMDNNQFVKEFYEETTPKADQYLGFKITPEMKEMVKTEGLPKFAAGGEVTDFIKRAA